MIFFPKLETDNCILDRITNDDMDMLRALFRDRLFRKYLPELRPLVRNSRGIKRFLSSFETLFSKNEGVMWGIRLGNVLVGIVAVMDLSYNPTIFFAMHPNFREKGFMKQSVSSVVYHILHKTKCCFLQSEVYIENIPSIKLLNSVGFKTKYMDKKKHYLIIET